jgi:hypothetical protein
LTIWESVIIDSRITWIPCEDIKDCLIECLISWFKENMTQSKYNEENEEKGSKSYEILADFKNHVT